MPRTTMMCYSWHVNTHGLVTWGKTYNFIIQDFFWPDLKADVVKFRGTSKVSHITGNINKIVSPDPLTQSLQSVNLLIVQPLTVLGHFKNAHTKVRTPTLLSVQTLLFLRWPSFRTINKSITKRQTGSPISCQDCSDLGILWDEIYCVQYQVTIVWH